MGKWAEDNYNLFFFSQGSTHSSFCVFKSDRLRFSGTLRVFSQRHYGKHALPCEIYNNSLSVWCDSGLLDFNSKPCLWHWQEGVMLSCPEGRGDTHCVELAKELLGSEHPQIAISILCRQPCPPWGSESPGNCCSSLSLREDMSSESKASFYDNLTFMLIWTLRKQLFVLDWSCSSCKISPITWGTKGKELRSSKVMMTEQIVGLCSCFPHIFRLLQSQFKWKSEHVATAVCVERKLLCSWWCFQEWGESVPLCLQWVLWECHGLGQGTATELYFCVLVLPHAAFILPHPGHRDITGREVLSRLMWVFEINCFSSVHLTPWITLGLEIFYPVVIFSRKTVLIHQKKLTLL